MTKLATLVDELFIVDKMLNKHRLGDVMTYPQRSVLAETQRQIDARRPVRILVLKARQVGISTLVEAVAFQSMFLRDRMAGLIVSHENKSAQHLLGITNHYWTTAWFKDGYTPKYASRYELKWDNGSSLEIATAANTGSGRSRTIQFLHASEVAFWPQPEKLFTGLRQSIPSTQGTFIYIESTANGVGNYFHDLWLAAKDGDVDYVPMFFPWWQHPEYKASIQCPDWLSKEIGVLDSEERALQKALLAFGDDEMKDRIMWRRWAIMNLCRGSLDTWHQEFPDTEELAFVSSGRNVFPYQELHYAYQPIDPRRGRLHLSGVTPKFVEDSEGPLRIYRDPAVNKAWGRYMVSVDPKAGEGQYGDYAVMQVLNRRTMEQVAVWRARLDSTSLGDEAVKLAKFYNDAMIAPEREGGGLATITRIVSLGYENLFRHHKTGTVQGQMDMTWGFNTNRHTKAEAVANLLQAVTRRHESVSDEWPQGQPWLVIHDEQTFGEMKNYVTLDNGGYGNSSENEHDDCVSALGIGVTACWQEAATLPGWHAAPDRIGAGKRVGQAMSIDGHVLSQGTLADPYALTKPNIQTDMYEGDW